MAKVNAKTFVRTRYESNSDDDGINRISDTELSVHGQTLQFDYIFKDTASQRQVFQEFEPAVEDAMNGYNVLLSTCGHSLTGKTYSMHGTSNQPGLIPQAISHLFETASLHHKVEYEFSMSCIQFKERYVHDMLIPNGIYNDIDSSIEFHKVPFTSYDDAIKIYRSGKSFLNDNVNGSHVGVTIHIKRVQEKGATFVSALKFLDISGPVALKNTNSNTTTTSYDNDSTLNFLYNEALGGNYKIYVLICVRSPLMYQQQSVQTLAHACSLKQIVNKVSRNEITTAANLPEEEGLDLLLLSPEEESSEEVTPLSPPPLSPSEMDRILSTHEENLTQTVINLFSKVFDCESLVRSLSPSDTSDDDNNTIEVLEKIFVTCKTHQAYSVQVLNDKLEMQKTQCDKLVTQESEKRISKLRHMILAELGHFVNDDDESLEDIVRAAATRLSSEIAIKEKCAAKISALKTQMGNDRSSFDSRVQQLLSDRQDLEAQVSARDAQITKLSADQADLSNRLDLETKCKNTLESRWDHSLSADSSNYHRLIQYQEQIVDILEEAKSTIGLKNKEISSLQTRLEEKESAVTLLQSQLKTEIDESKEVKRTMQSTIANYKEALEDQNRHQERVDMLQCELESANARVADLIKVDDSSEEVVHKIQRKARRRYREQLKTELAEKDASHASYVEKLKNTFNAILSDEMQKLSTKLAVEHERKLELRVDELSHGHSVVLERITLEYEAHIAKLKKDSVVMTTSCLTTGTQTTDTTTSTSTSTQTTNHTTSTSTSTQTTIEEDNDLREKLRARDIELEALRRDIDYFQQSSDKVAALEATVEKLNASVRVSNENETRAVAEFLSLRERYDKQRKSLKELNDEKLGLLLMNQLSNDNDNSNSGNVQEYVQANKILQSEVQQMKLEVRDYTSQVSDLHARHAADATYIKELESRYGSSNNDQVLLEDLLNDSTSQMLSSEDLNESFRKQDLEEDFGPEKSSSIDNFID